MLAQFAQYERLEAGASQEPLAGSLVSFASFTPDGIRDGPRLYSDVLVPSDERTFGEVQGEPLRGELQEHRGLPCAPGSAPREYFAPHVLAEHGHLGVVASVQAAPGPSPSLLGLQAPISSVLATRRTRQWEGPGG